MIRTIPTGNEEVDRQLAGGIPTPCLMMIEGCLLYTSDAADE